MDGNRTTTIKDVWHGEIELKPFKPCAYTLESMNQAIIITQDVSATNVWHGRICLESLRHPYKKRLVGFHLVSLKGLQRLGQTRSVWRLLTRAVRFDLSEKAQHGKSKWHVLRVYASAYWLLLPHPRTWWLKDD